MIRTAWGLFAALTLIACSQSPERSPNNRPSQSRDSGQSAADATTQSDEDGGESVDLGQSGGDAGFMDAQMPADAGAECPGSCPTADYRCQGMRLEQCRPRPSDGCSIWELAQLCTGACVNNQCQGCGDDADCPSRQRCDMSQCVDRDAWAEVNLDFVGGPTRSLEGCYFCDANLYSGGALLRFQQDRGYSIWSLYLEGEAFAPGRYSFSRDRVGKLRIFLNEADMAVPEQFRGGYDSVSGTLELSRVELRAGGVVTGRLDVQLEGNASASRQLRLQGEFKATFP